MTLTNAQGHPLTCRSCEHSIHRAFGQEIFLGRLWCGLKNALALHRCAEFVFEPGTDEMEWKR